VILRIPVQRVGTGGVFCVRDNVFIWEYVIRGTMKVLITGGTGSFGHIATRELLTRDDVEKIVIYSRGEEKQREMRLSFPDDRVKFIIGDTRDYEQVYESVKGIDIIFHAAALKQMPTIEECPYEAVKTNIIGTWNVKRAAIENKVNKALLIGTDKAVMPINAYGMTKALAEKIWLNFESDENTPRFAVVRYGNVVGSTGSVIPIFRGMIKQKKPLLITNPGMTRFLITLKQAIELVFFAVENMKNRETYVPKIPACKIIDLAKAIGGEEYPIKIIGIRPGEKIHETLVNEDEMRRAKECKNCFIIYPRGCYDSGIIFDEFRSDKTEQLSISEIKELLEETGV